MKLWVTSMVTGSNSLGSGFKARVLPNDLRNGAIKLELVNQAKVTQFLQLYYFQAVPSLLNIGREKTISN